MAEIFKNIYKALERSNKKNMISSSGSTPDADHEKVRSGQSYLYKTYGMESEVVEIRFHKKVYGSHLNKALRTALERYPYPNTKLVELDIDSPSFMKVCKANGATPVVLTSLLMSAGIAGMFPDFDKPINANIAVDIRDALDLPNTFKNCVRSMPLPYTREFLDMPLDAQAKQQRALLNAQRDRDNCRRAANASLALFDKLDTMEGYEAKQSMMDFLGGMLLNTYTISYLGQMRVNENAQYIDVIGIYNSGSAGISISMIACGDKFCFNFKQSFESDRYVKAFRRGLDEHGIEYSASEVIPFVTPKDEIIKRD